MNSTIYTIEDLIYLMSRLRNPETGCPWDLEQDAVSLVPYLLEEAYEVADTIERGDLNHLSEELGDLLFQVVFHARMAEEEDRFTFNDVVATLVAKLVSRHPHVFPDGTLQSHRERDQVISNREIGDVWERKKRAERNRKGHRSLLADVPRGFPALTRAQKIQKRAARAGFDWSNIEGVLEKVREEITELENELDDDNRERLEDEMGDLFFSLVNLARHLGLDSESALRKATGKFEERFNVMEEIVDREEAQMDELSVEELDRLWNRAKQAGG